MEDFQQKYLTEKREETSPSHRNLSRDEASRHHAIHTNDHFFQLVDQESPMIHSSEDLSKRGTDPRRHIIQRNSQFNHGQYDARNKTTGLGGIQGKTHQLTNDSSLNSYQTNMVVASQNSKVPNPRSLFNKTQNSAQNSNKSGPQLPQKTKSEPLSAIQVQTKGQTNNEIQAGNPRAFAKTKESVDKHVTIDLYQAVYGEETNASHKPTFSQSEVPCDQAKSMQNFNTQYNASTVPVSSNTSIKNSPMRKRHSGMVSPNIGSMQGQYIGNFKLPQSKYAKSSMYKTRNTKVKANTIIAQIQSMADGTNHIRSPVRQKTMNIQSAVLHKIAPSSRHSQNLANYDGQHSTQMYQKVSSKKTMAQKNSQPKLFESSSKGKIVKQLSPTNSNPTASLQANQLGPAKLTNGRKNMKSQEQLNNKKNSQQIKMNQIMKPNNQVTKRMRNSNIKGSQGVTPKSSVYRGTDNSQSNRNSKSPMSRKQQDKTSFSNSNMSVTTRQDKHHFMAKLGQFQGNKTMHPQQQTIDSVTTGRGAGHNIHVSRTSPKLVTHTAFSASVTRCQPTQKKSSHLKQATNRPRIDNHDKNAAKNNTVSLVQDGWQSKMHLSTGQDIKSVQKPAEVREVHIQEVDDPSEFNPLNRTNQQENERMMKFSSLNMNQVQNPQYAQTMMLPSPQVINNNNVQSELKSQVTMFSPHLTNSGMSPTPGSQAKISPGQQKNYATQGMQKVNQLQINQGKHSKGNIQANQRQQNSNNKTAQKDTAANMGVINFNNYINGETDGTHMPMKTEGNKVDGEGSNLTSLVHEERNQKVKSAMIVLSQQKNQAGYQQKLGEQIRQSQSRSLSDDNVSKDGRRLDNQFADEKSRIKPQTTVLITQEGDFIETNFDPNRYKQSPSVSNMTSNANNTAHFKATAGKKTVEHMSTQGNAGGVSMVAVQSTSNKIGKKNDSSSNSLVVIDGVESPVPKIINEVAHGSKPSGGGFGAHQASGNASDSNPPLTLGPNSSGFPRQSQVSHEGGACNSSTQRGPMSRLTPSPRLKKLPRKDKKRDSQPKHAGEEDIINFDGEQLNPRVKVYDNEEAQKFANDDEMQPKQGVETGRFKQVGSTLKKSPKYQEYLSGQNEQFRTNPVNTSGQQMVVPELNLSPRSDSQEQEVELIKNNQRKLFENIQAQYVNNGSVGLSNSKLNAKSHSTKIEDKLIQNKSVPSNSNSYHSQSNAQNTVNAQKRKLMKKSSLLAKSLVEDASEDFSNIEEHISTFYNQQTLQTGNMTAQAQGTTIEEDMKNYQESASDQVSKDKMIADKFKNALQGDTVSRTQAQRQDLYLSTNFGSTLDNPMQYDENENNIYLKNMPQSGFTNKHQGLISAPSANKMKNRQIVGYNTSGSGSGSASGGGPVSASGPVNAGIHSGPYSAGTGNHQALSVNHSKKTSYLQSVQKVNHNANNISLNYGRQVPKTLFGKVVHSMNNSHYHHGQRYSNVSSGQGGAFASGQIHTNVANTYYGDSREPSVKQKQLTQKNSYRHTQSNNEFDMRDSCREVTSCQNSNIFCGYQTRQSCGISNESQVVMEHQVKLDEPESVRVVETKNPTPPPVANVNQPAPIKLQNAHVQKKKPKTKGIHDLVTSVPMNQKSNSFQVNTVPKNPPSEKVTASVASVSPQTNSQTSPISKQNTNSGVVYSPEADEMNTVTNNKPMQTPSHFDGAEMSEAVKEYSREASQSRQQEKQPATKDPETQSNDHKTQSESDLHKNHLIQTMQSLHYMKMATPPDPKVIADKSVTLPPSNFRKTLIFDLDETLVHCVDDIENLPYDLPISVQFQQGERIDAGINVRPYVYDCLKQAKKYYQVVIFTASHKSYADAVLDTLEEEFRRDVYLTEEERQMIESKPEAERQQAIKDLKREQKLIDYRLYREHCYKTSENVFIKDLRILKNKDLSQLLIVDNAVYSFGFQLSNGIPIIPFYDSHATNINDEELVHLVYYFSCIVESEDVRVQNRRAFQLEELKMMDIAQQLRIIQNGSQSQTKEEDSGNYPDGPTDNENDQGNDQYGYEPYHNEYGNRGQLANQQYQAYKQNVHDLGHKRMSDNSNRGYEHNGTIPEQEEEDEDEESLMNQNNKVQRERRKKAAQIVTQTSVNSSQGSSNKKKWTQSQQNSIIKK